MSASSVCDVVNVDLDRVVELAEKCQQANDDFPRARRSFSGLDLFKLYTGPDDSPNVLKDLHVLALRDDDFRVEAVWPIVIPDELLANIALLNALAFAVEKVSRRNRSDDLEAQVKFGL